MAESERAHDLSPGLLRQRRNLMITSLALIFVTCAEAKFDSISMLGAQISFKNPKAIIDFIWLSHFYYLFRYYQYFRQEPDLNIQKTFYDKLCELTFQKVDALKKRAFPGVDEYAGDYDFRQMKKLSAWKREVTAVARRDRSGLENGSFQIDVRPFWLEAIRSCAHVFLNRSYVTDYFLPFGLAVAAIVIGTSYWVNHSLLWATLTGHC